MGWFGPLRARRAAPRRRRATGAGHGDEGPSASSIDAALRAERERYAALYDAAAACLYTTHRLASEVAACEAIAQRARRAAHEALAQGDAPRSRAMVLRAGAALERGRRTETQRRAMRASADDALEALRRVGESIAELTRGRLRWRLDRALHAEPSPELGRARRALELLDAERELERELD